MLLYTIFTRHGKTNRTLQITEAEPVLRPFWPYSELRTVDVVTGGVFNTRVSPRRRTRSVLTSKSCTSTLGSNRTSKYRR